MLVLTRQVGQRIFIRSEAGEEIVITLVEVDRNKVRIGIDAPKHLRIHREEVMPPRAGEDTGVVDTIDK